VTPGDFLIATGLGAVLTAALVWFARNSILEWLKTKLSEQLEVKKSELQAVLEVKKSELSRSTDILRHELQRDMPAGGAAHEARVRRLPSNSRKVARRRRARAAGMPECGG
jgi:hypothetical protein